ncbi:hypothetical protein MRB53_028512 [Persea americana]|uniref:Uncharacterized protein n=1 Tax=Persea americana TaxID=3435 RepID=A0ACC2KG67_PERAE|nr:hypothetical protein MRB53_028512 [Persea americana]
MGRLDRGLGSTQWFNHYPNFQIQHLSRLGSDHNPLFLRPSNWRRPVQWAFRYESFWHHKDDFFPWVQNTWLELGDASKLCGKLANLAGKLTEWSSKEFGNIFREVDTLKKRIFGIQASRRYHTSAFLKDLEANLSNQYFSKLREVDTFWAQRARVNWLQKGDQNTKYFHALAKMHHRRNQISSFTSSEGELITDPSAMRNHCLEYFKDLFQDVDKDKNLDLKLPDYLTSFIHEEDNTSLIRIPSEYEIRKATFSIDWRKAPGPDGYNANFFRCFWTAIKNDVLDHSITYEEIDRISHSRERTVIGGRGSMAVDLHSILYSSSFSVL